MNSGMKAVLGGVTVGLIFAVCCAMFFGVYRGDSAYDSPTIKTTLFICVFVSAFTSAKVALASTKQNGGDKPNE